MSKVPLLGQYFTATVPDGPVNRAVQVTVVLDTDTGQLTGHFDLDAAREAAMGPDGQLPRVQRTGPDAAPPDVPTFAGDGEHQADDDRAPVGAYSGGSTL